LKKFLLLLSLIFLNKNIYGADNKCNKCFKLCVNKANYNILNAEEINNLLKEKKLSIIKDKDNILNESNLSILKNNNITREGSFYSNQYLSLILGCKCCEECQKNECINSK
jgi:hypothetical protein